MEKMINTMMKRYQMFAWLGLIIVLVAFWLAALANVARHSIAAWVPSFKFLGLGVMLGAITMALGMIAQTLRDLGGEMMAKWPADLNPGLPAKPRSARLFPMIMMMGWMILIVGLIWALSLNGVVGQYWNHAVATELNTAGPGSLLLQQLGVISSTFPWLGAVRFTGMAFLFTGITVALTVIIRTLQHQEASLQRFLQAASGK